MLSVESASASDINEADIATAGRPDNGLSESEDDEAEVAERTLSYDLLIGADGAHR